MIGASARGLRPPQAQCGPVLTPHYGTLPLQDRQSRHAASGASASPTRLMTALGHRLPNPRQPRQLRQAPRLFQQGSRVSRSAMHGTTPLNPPAPTRLASTCISACTAAGIPRFPAGRRNTKPFNAAVTAASTTMRSSAGHCIRLGRSQQPRNVFTPTNDSFHPDQ